MLSVQDVLSKLCFSAEMFYHLSTDDVAAQQGFALVFQSAGEFSIFS